MTVHDSVHCLTMRQLNYKFLKKVIVDFLSDRFFTFTEDTYEHYKIKRFIDRPFALAENGPVANLIFS